MKLYYWFFISAMLLMPYRIMLFEDPAKLNKNITKLSNSFEQLTQEGKENLYNKARNFLYEAFPSNWVSNTVIDPQYEHIRNRALEDFGEVKKEVKTAGLWTGGAVALGGAAIGLYRWATRRGLGGIVKDVLEKNKLDSKIQYQVSQKISALQIKKGLSETDRLQAQSLLNIIKNRITTDNNTIKFLKDAQKNLEKIINPESEKNKHLPVPTDQG